MVSNFRLKTPIAEQNDGQYKIYFYSKGWFHYTSRSPDIDYLFIPPGTSTEIHLEIQEKSKIPKTGIFKTWPSLISAVDCVPEGTIYRYQGLTVTHNFLA